MSNTSVLYYIKTRRVVVIMSYVSIAELVHDLVKNPKNMLSTELPQPSSDLNTNELTIIQRVFTKYEVSADTLTIGVTPMGVWG